MQFQRFEQHPLLTTEEAAAYLGLAPQTLRNWRWQGIAPEEWGSSNVS
jgi:hypothetical protein